MKKTKLLMPILGVAATLGAVVPAVVACGPKAEEEETNVKTEITSSTEGNTVEIIATDTPKIVAGQYYIAGFEWKEIDGTTKQEISNSFCSAATVTDAEATYTAADEIQIFKQAHRQVRVYIPADVTSKLVGEITINLTVKAGQANEVIKLNQAGPVTSYTYEQKDGVFGTLPADLSTYDNIIEYEIPLATLEAALQKGGKTLVGARKIAVWMEAATGDIWGTKRPQPTDTGYVYLGQEYVSSSWSNTSRAITITLNHALTATEVEGLQIFSYFDYSNSLEYMNLQNGKCCAYCLDPQDPQDK